MTCLDAQLISFKDEAVQQLGTDAVVATLDDLGWVENFAPFVQPDGGKCWIPHLQPDDDSTVRTNWYGLLDLWGDTGRRVLMRRHLFAGPYGETFAVTLVAAANQADIDHAVRHGRSLWRDWRRNSARIRDARGSDVEVTPVAWEQVYLPEGQLDDIRTNVVHFANAREMYERLGLPYRRGLLFYGAPGNGKTMLCRAIVTALGWPVVYVSPNSRRDTSDELRNAFREAKELAPCVLWFDDVDALFESDATMSSFWNRLDGAASAEGILVLATTNRPEKLDPSIVARPSRFDRIFPIGSPAAAERDRFFARRFGAGLDAVSRADLVKRTAGMSMAFVQEVFVGAALRALQRGELPNVHDALEVHTALAKHAREADRGFEESGATGFGRLPG
jgi:SpoVK/Ycf46/Vps4 family AAA+-type ATPase